MMTAFRRVSRQYRGLFSLAAVASLLAVSGCGGGEAGGDKFKGDRGSVSGKMTYKGTPVPAGSSVMFQAVAGYTGVGKTNDKGEYTLTYDGKATLPGVTYKIQLSPPPSAPVMMDPATVGTKPSAAAPSPFPAKYSSTTTSGLEFTVKAGANKADFDLTD